MSQFIELAKRGGNEALDLNPARGVDFHITKGGSDWLFAACAIFATLGFVVMIIMFCKPMNERLHYYTAIAPTFFMAIAYFTMGSNLGWTSTQALYNRNRVSTQTTHLGFRQVFYARYIGWFLSFPFPVIQAGIMGHTSMWHMFFNVLMTEVYVVSYLIGILIHSQYKWGYYTIGTLAMIIVWTSVCTSTRNFLQKKGGELFLMFNVFWGFIMAFWGIYPLVWGLCEGGNVLVPDAEAIWYGVMDLLIMGVMPCLFVPLTGYFGLETYGYKFADEEAALPPPPPKSPKNKSAATLKKKKKGKK